MEQLRTENANPRVVTEAMQGCVKPEQELQQLIWLTLEEPSELRRRVQRALRWFSEYEQAKHDLAANQHGCVVRLATESQEYGVPVQALVREGDTAVRQAVERYRHCSDFSFRRYVTWVIRRGMVRVIISYHVRQEVQVTSRGAVRRLLGAIFGECPVLDDMMREYPLPWLDEGLQRLTHRERAMLQLRYGIVDGFTTATEVVAIMFQVRAPRDNSNQPMAQPEGGDRSPPSQSGLRA